MTNGWEAASPPIALDAPWEAYWVKVFVDPPLGLYIDMMAALRAAETTPTEERLDALIAHLPPMLAEHNITNASGEPIEWRARNMGVKLIVGVARAIKRVQDGGAPADPLPGSRKRGTSPATGSQGSRSRRNTRSGASRSR